MGSETSLHPLATRSAEEILRMIYGDDFHGCEVSLESVAKVVHEAMVESAVQERELMNVYEKLVEALHRLSTPPEGGTALDPSGLRSLLGDRLDAINSLTTKALQTTATVRGVRGGNGAGE